MDWAISSRSLNRGGFNDYLGGEGRLKRAEIGSPNPLMRYGEDIVCTLQKCEGVRKRRKGLATLFEQMDLTGETVSQYNENGMALGDTRISMALPRDEYSLQLHRDHRFLIDDYESGTVLAYRLTKPFKLGGVYNNEGAMTFVLTEVNTEDDDNFELHIADYYKYFPRTDNVMVPEPEHVKVTEDGKKVWL